MKTAARQSEEMFESFPMVGGRAGLSEEPNGVHSAG